MAIICWSDSAPRSLSLSVLFKQMSLDERRRPFITPHFSSGEQHIPRSCVDILHFDPESHSFIYSYCVGNLIGPQLFFAREAPRYQSGFESWIICFCVQIIVVAAMYTVNLRENRRVRLCAFSLMLSHTD